MNNLFVSLLPFEDDNKSGLPAHIYRIYTEEFNPKQPMKPVYSTDWLFYMPKRDGVPVPENLRLPPNLFMVCKGLRKITFDFYTQEAGEWVVSADFLNFLQTNNLLKEHYEISKLTILTTTGKNLGEKPYFLLRLFKYDNELVDWENCPAIDADRKTGINFKFYPDLSFHSGVKVPEMLFINQIAFKHSFIVNDNIKSLMEKENFVGFDFYTLPDFAEESQKRIDYFKPKT